MIRHSYKDGLELMVAARDEALSIDDKHQVLKDLYYDAIHEQNNQLRLAKMKVLRDALNGYYTRIHSIVTKGITYYKKRKNKQEWLERITGRGRDTIYEIDNVMKEISVMRNESSHDIVYQINLRALDDREELREILFKIADKIDSVSSYNDLDQRRETKSQNGWLVNRFNQYEGFNGNDRFNNESDTDDLLPIDYIPSFMYK